MKFEDTGTPVVVLHCALGALAIMRSLGSQGVAVYGVSNKPNAHALRSRYCRESFIYPYDKQPSAALAEYLMDLSRRFHRKPVLIATSDETAIAVAEHRDRLAEVFLIAQNGGPIVATLADKMTMFGLAREHRVPVPMTVLPRSLQEAADYARSVSYPVMLKGAMGNRLAERTGKKMVVVNSAEELIARYTELEDPEQPNLMIQELISGGDDEVYIFNGYFDQRSNCLAGFTGRKIRQFPVHVGCASLGECCTVDEVARITTTFMKEIGYTGILDIGYRKDLRDGSYKVLDINPRVGQAFRLFTSEDDWDVVRVMYADLTGQYVPKEIVPREGRRWVIEDYDLTSTVDYLREGSLTLSEWIKSYRRLEEGAWFSLKDPIPFLLMLSRLGKQTARWIGKRLRGVR